jgi:hypothetical protein
MDEMDRCQPPMIDGQPNEAWEYTHSWVGGMTIVNAADVADVAERRPDVACQYCDETYVSLAGS